MTNVSTETDRPAALRLPSHRAGENNQREIVAAVPDLNNKH